MTQWRTMCVASATLALTASFAVAGSSNGGKYYGPIHAGPNKHAEATKTKHHAKLIRGMPDLEPVSVLNNENGHENGKVSGAVWLIANKDFKPVKVKVDEQYGGPWVKHLKGPKFNGIPNNDNGHDNGNGWGDEWDDWGDDYEDDNGWKGDNGENGYNGPTHAGDDFKDGDGIYVGKDPSFNGDWAKKEKNQVTAGVIEYLKVGKGDHMRKWTEKILSKKAHWGAVAAIVLNKDNKPVATGATQDGNGYYGNGITLERKKGKLSFHFKHALKKGDKLVTLKQLKFRKKRDGVWGPVFGGMRVGKDYGLKIAQYPSAIPTPTAIGGGLLMLGGLVLRRRRQQAG
jgi:MYXO-CTERM domain-containing protein